MEEGTTLRERIALGECVSPGTTERSPVCIDMCEAFHGRVELNQLLRDSKIKPQDDQRKER